MISTSTLPRWRRALAFFHPSHRHSAFSATLLLMISTFLSRCVGIVRVKYIAWLLGSSASADAFNAAFQLPDMLAYFLVGAATSTTFTTILTRCRNTGREKEGERSMSVILTTMALVLGVAILIAEVFAPVFIHWWFNGFPPEKSALCVHLTRILLPAQLCIFAGGVFGSVLLCRKIFFAQALAPVIYSLGTILGGLLFGQAFGVSALAAGTLAGAFAGPLMLNAVGAHRTGIRYRPMLDWSDPGLREWFGMSVPLILGVSLVQADTWIISHFASGISGGIARLGYAKQMFQFTVSIGQAAGAASLPFLASLAAKGDRTEFARKVNSGVSQIAAFCLVLSSLCIGLSKPLVDLIMRGGAFHRSDTGPVAGYFAIFSISLFLWSAQALYARAFYATPDTLTPMIAATLVTFVSIPMYSGLFHSFGAIGLAIASDVGITIQTLTLAILLHRRRMISLGGLQYIEILRALLAACACVGALAALGQVCTASTRISELILVGLGTAVWGTVAFIVLRVTGSSIPDRIVARLLHG